MQNNHPRLNAVLLMYSCDWFQGGLWRYGYNLAKNLLVLDREGRYTFLHGREKKENFFGLESREAILPQAGWQKAFYLPKVLQQRGFNLVHQTENACPTFSQGQTYKKVVTIHDLTPYKFPKFFSRRDFFYYRFYLPRALRTTDIIITPSQSTKNELAEFYKIPERKIVVIYEGLEQAFFENFTKDQLTHNLKGLGITKPYILTMGINYHRNFPTLFKAYNSLSKPTQEEFDLVVAGYTGMEEKKRFFGRATVNLIAEAQKYGLGDKIKFVGNVSNEALRMLYQGASVFAFPSLSEGFGFPPLEAMASGCPVVSSSATAMKEMLGEAGLLVEPLNWEQWQSALTQVLSSQETRNNLIAKGFQQAKKFSWETCAKEHLKVYYG